jgi:hypothetical protein
MSNGSLSGSADLSRFCRLLKEYRAVAARPSVEPNEQRRRFQSLLNDFHSTIGKWRESQERTADDFNLLDVMQVNGRELMHSGVLAWLLARDLIGQGVLGTHAQGSLGFRLFLEEVGLPSSYASDDNSYWVATEVCGAESIMDVEVACRGRFLIHIENKIWSCEGEEQTRREWRDARRRANDLNIPKANVHAFFLSPDGRSPVENNFIPLSWSQIAAVFERFADAAKPPDVKLFCKHYARALRRSIVEQKQPEAREDDIPHVQRTGIISDRKLERRSCSGTDDEERPQEVRPDAVADGRGGCERMSAEDAR